MRFCVAPGSGVFTNLNVESGTSAFPTPDSSGDLPVSDIVRDDQTGKLYVGTDFGVLWNNGNDKGNCEFKHFNELAARFGIVFNEDKANTGGPSFAVRGPASDLLLLISNRRSAEGLEVFGDQSVLEQWSDHVKL